MALQFWRMINKLSPVSPLHPVKLNDLRSLQVFEIPSIALRLNAEVHPPRLHNKKNYVLYYQAKTRAYPKTNPEL